MSTEKTGPDQPPKPVEKPLSMLDLAAILVKHYGLHNGCYDLMVEFQIGAGPVGPQNGTRMPGAMVGVSRVGLIPSRTGGPTTVDAAIVNPTKKTRKKKVA